MTGNAYAFEGLYDILTGSQSPRHLWPWVIVFVPAAKTIKLKSFSTLQSKHSDASMRLINPPLKYCKYVYLEILLRAHNLSEVHTVLVFWVECFCNMPWSKIIKFRFKWEILKKSCLAEEEPHVPLQPQSVVGGGYPLGTRAKNAVSMWLVESCPIIFPNMTLHMFLFHLRLDNQSTNQQWQFHPKLLLSSHIESLVPTDGGCGL